MFPDVKQRSFLLKLHKDAKKKQYDVDHYNSLVDQLKGAENDLRKIRQPLGLAIPEHELKALLRQKN